MSKKEPQYIDHPGVVKSIDPPFMTVEFLNPSACSSCHAKGMCGAGGDKIKELEVELTLGDYFEVGESVNIKMKRVMGYRALWISYLIPLLILLLLLLSLSFMGFSEVTTAFSIIAGLTLYYIGVWLFRDKLKKEFTFVIEKV